MAVVGRKSGRPPVRLATSGPVEIPAGGTAQVQFAVPRGPMLDQVQLALNDPPAGVSIQKTSRDKEGLTLVLHADADKAKPGTSGNLIVDAFIERLPPAKEGKPQGNKTRRRWACCRQSLLKLSSDLTSNLSSRLFT